MGPPGGMWSGVIESAIIDVYETQKKLALIINQKTITFMQRGTYILVDGQTQPPNSFDYSVYCYVEDVVLFGG